MTPSPCETLALVLSAARVLLRALVLDGGRPQFLRIGTLSFDQPDMYVDAVMPDGSSLPIAHVAEPQDLEMLGWSDCDDAFQDLKAAIVAAKIDSYIFDMAAVAQTFDVVRWVTDGGPSEPRTHYFRRHGAGSEALEPGLRPLLEGLTRVARTLETNGSRTIMYPHDPLHAHRISAHMRMAEAATLREIGTDAETLARAARVSLDHYSMWIRRSSDMAIVTAGYALQGDEEFSLAVLDLKQDPAGS